MRSLATLLVLLGLGMFMVGCGDTATPPDVDTPEVDIEEPADMADDPGMEEGAEEAGGEEEAGAEEAAGEEEAGGEEPTTE